MSKLLILVVIAAIPALANDTDDIRAVLRTFNDAVRRADPQPLRQLFTAEADYKDVARSFTGPGSLAEFFSSPQVWSERTPPILQDESIRFTGSSTAFVDAHLVQYGSMIVRSGVPVAILMEKKSGAWKIGSWRTVGCFMPMLLPAREGSPQTR